jgi:hypothetical protein
LLGATCGACGAYTAFEQVPPFGPAQAVPYSDLPEAQTWVLKDHTINKLQQRSIEQLVRRCKSAHQTDCILRINGTYEVYQADWIKSLAPSGDGQHD